MWCGEPVEARGRAGLESTGALEEQRPFRYRQHCYTSVPGMAPGTVLFFLALTVNCFSSNPGAPSEVQGKTGKQVGQVLESYNGNP